MTHLLRTFDQNRKKKNAGSKVVKVVKRIGNMHEKKERNCRPTAGFCLIMPRGVSLAQREWCNRKSVKQCSELAPNDVAATGGESRNESKNPDKTDTSWLS